MQPAPDLQGVNGQVVTVIGETEIRIDHVRQPVKVRIVDDLNQNMILGCDVLAGAQIDMSRRILTMHGHSWSLFSNDIGIAGLGSVLPVTGSPPFNELLRRNADVFSANKDAIGNCKKFPMHTLPVGSAPQTLRAGDTVLLPGEPSSSFFALGSAATQSNGRHVH